MRSLIIVTMLFALACESGRSDKPGPAPAPPPTEKPAKTETAPTDGDKAPEAEQPAGASAAKPIDEGAVRELLDGWLSAQNGGDYNAYRALYATKFLGVKRIGARAFRYDNAGWLGDRARMFKKAMTVEAADVQIAAAPQAAVVTFTQTWASGSYRDVGPKQLVVVREGDALRIAREEMLSSHMVSGAGAKGDPAKLAFVERFGPTGKETTFVILHTDAEAGWAAKGKPSLVSREFPVVASRAADGLPADLGAWKGRAVELFGAEGPVCRGTVGDLVVLARVAPHFGTRQDWDGDPDVSEAGRASDGRVAAEAWELAGTTVLAGRVTAEGSCDKAVWARAADAAAPAAWARGKGPEADALAKKATEALRKLPAWKEIQEGFASEPAEEGKPRGKWDEYDETVPQFAIFADPKGGRHLVATAVAAGSGCGDFYGELWAVWMVEGETWTLLSSDKEPGEYFLPDAAVDSDGDGTVELIDGDTVMRHVGGTYVPAETATVPDLDCPC